MITAEQMNMIANHAIESEKIMLQHRLEKAIAMVEMGIKTAANKGDFEVTIFNIPDEFTIEIMSCFAKNDFITTNNIGMQGITFNWNKITTKKQNGTR